MKIWLFMTQIFKHTLRAILMTLNWIQTQVTDPESKLMCLTKCLFAIAYFHLSIKSKL